MAGQGFTLRVTCHGAIAYVPQDDAFTALLCQLPDTVKKPTVYVRFPEKNYHNDKRKPDGVPPDPARDEVKGLAHVILHNERISIVGKTAESALNVDDSSDPLGISNTPTAADARSIRWLPDIEKLAGGKPLGKIKPEYLQVPAVANPALLARIDFTKGRLSTTGVERVQVPFRPVSATKGGGERMPMAREALLEMQIDDDHVTFQSDPLDGKPRDPTKDMRFEVDAGGVLDIVIGNEPLSDIYAETPPIDPIDVVAADAVNEFQFYFQLCDVLPPNPKVPLVAARPGLQTFCSGGRFAKP